MRRLLRAVALISGCALGSVGGFSAGGVSFYKNKTITLVTGDGGGGLYDLVARTMAEYLPRYIPGAPSIVVQGMPGASQVRATEYIQNVAARDGLTVGLVQPYVMLNKLLHPHAQYDPRQLTWLGRILPLTQIGFAMRTVRVRSIADAKARSINLGAAGATGPAAMVPWALDRMIGTKFHVVMGYTDDSSEFLALERGELEGLGSANYSSLLHRPGWMQKKLFVPLYAISPRRLPALPATPTILELTGDPAQRAVLQVLVTIPEIGITLMAPPGLPKDRVLVLRHAVDQVNKDPKFRADMSKLLMNVDPMTGQEIGNLVAEAMNVGPDVVKAIVQSTAPMN